MEEQRNEEDSTPEAVEGLRRKQDAVLNENEMKRLKNSGYGKDTARESWKTYVIRNKRSGKIAELRAASPLHAAKMIGWRRRHVTVLEEKELPED